MLEHDKEHFKVIISRLDHVILTDALHDAKERLDLLHREANRRIIAEYPEVTEIGISTTSPTLKFALLKRMQRDGVPICEEMPERGDR